MCLTNRFDLHGDDTNLNELIDEIKVYQEMFLDTPLEVVVIDTFAKVTPGLTENDGKDVGMVMARLDRIRTELSTGVWLVHHMNAAGSGPRGHTSLLAGYESGIQVVRGEDKHEYQRHDGKQVLADVRYAILKKQKEGEDGIRWRFFLEDILVERDDDGSPRYSGCVRPLDVDVVDNRLGGLNISDGMMIVLRALKKAVEDYGEDPPPGMARNVYKIVNADHWFSAYMRLSGDEGEDTIRKKLKRANDWLQAHNVIDRDNPYVWFAGRRVNGFEVPVKRDAESSQSWEGRNVMESEVDFMNYG